ncbi:MAG TPA: pectin acetylesterase-family hydrolase [Kofleriaceae bacterium]|nr:pectin acetylesterase-family hydrolase [Kofleriaceae bacterium]
MRARCSWLVMALVAPIGFGSVGCGGGDDGGGGDDDGVDVDAANNAGGPPTLAGTPGTWSFVDTPGSSCMNGSQTGFGVNLGTSGDLVLYMEGGGACFNSFTCSSVAHQNGFGAGDLANAVRQGGTAGIFDRTSAANPLKDATFVFFPYCSGDVFGGSAEGGTGFGGRTQVGYDNVGLWLDQIVPQSGPVGRVIVTGSSAGGFGALYNFDRIEKRFEDKTVFLIDDSGPPMGDMWLTPCLQTQMRTSWKLNETLPDDCDACQGGDGGGLVNALPFLADRHSDRRLALISATQDGVIRSFYGFGYPNCNSIQPMPAQAFSDGLTNLRDVVLAGKSNFKVMSYTSTSHVWLFNDFNTTMTGGVTLGAWLTAMLDGSSSWDHAGP